MHNLTIPTITFIHKHDIPREFTRFNMVYNIILCKSSWDIPYIV